MIAKQGNNHKVWENSKIVPKMHYQNHQNQVDTGKRKIVCEG